MALKGLKHIRVAYVMLFVLAIAVALSPQLTNAANQSQASTTCTAQPNFDVLQKAEDFTDFDRNSAFSFVVVQNGGYDSIVFYNASGTNPIELRKTETGVYQVYSTTTIKRVHIDYGGNFIGEYDFAVNYNAFACGELTKNVTYTDWDVPQYPTYTQPEDMCTNIDGLQATIPDGYIQDNRDNSCYLPSDDVCPDIEHLQTDPALCPAPPGEPPVSGSLTATELRQLLHEYAIKAAGFTIALIFGGASVYAMRWHHV